MCWPIVGGGRGVGRLINTPPRKKNLEIRRAYQGKLQNTSYILCDINLFDPNQCLHSTWEFQVFIETEPSNNNKYNSRLNAPMGWSNNYDYNRLMVLYAVMWYSLNISSLTTRYLNWNSSKRGGRQASSSVGKSWFFYFSSPKLVNSFII